MGIEALVQEWAAAFSARDADCLTAAFVDDLIYEDVPLQLTCKNKDELRAFVEPWFKAIPDFAVRLEGIIAQGDKAAAQWSWAGTQEGDLPPSFPASSKHFSTVGISVFEARERKLVKVVDYWDLLNVLKQLGFA